MFGFGQGSYERSSREALPVNMDVFEMPPQQGMELIIVKFLDVKWIGVTRLIGISQPIG